MAVIQCDNCGATLSEADLFCGECGAPQPLAGRQEPQLPDISPAEVPVDASVPRRSGQPEPRWYIAAVSLVVLGGITCLASVLAFLFAGFHEYEAMTLLENWLFSAACCLLPFGGAGAILVAGGSVVWYTRLRNL